MLKNTLITLAGVVLAICLVYGGWKLERYINYKWNYQNSVQADIDKQLKPLTARIQKLEIEVQILKTNRF